MNWLSLKFLTLPAALVALTLTAACEEQGPAEQAGERIDEAVEETRDAIERAGERRD